MDQLIASRLKKPQEVSRLDTLSPEKFGRSAYANLTYTPSKLATNVLYKQVSQMRRVEQNGSKVRQFEALNAMLREKNRHLTSQKDGIEQTLSQQIVMYKKMIAQMQDTQEQRLHQLQAVFSDQIQRIILQKQEEAKYVQSEKQLLENRIFELEDIIAELKQQLAHRVTIFDQLKKEHEKLQIHLQNSNERCEGLEIEIKQLQQQSKNEINKLNNKIFGMQSDYKNKVQKIQLDKQKELQNQQRLHRTQLQKIQNRRAQELMMKNQELKDLSTTFEAEAKRLNDAIAKQDEYIKNLNQGIKQEKQNLLKITKQFTIQITNLKNQNDKLREQCFNLSKNLQKQKQEVKKMKSASSQTSANLEDQMKRIKKQLEQAQLAFVKQRDRLIFQADDMRNEIIILRKHTQSSSRLLDENNALCRQIRSLKELLMESSLEMQRCKDQFVQLATDKQNLIVKLHELDLQNQKLHRIALEREQEAQGWRESYYKYRR